MVTYTQNKIHEIWSIAYWFLAEDGINKFKQSKGNNSSDT